ncbi:TcpQ domain-containing protein [Vibrio mediterranei]|uniref:TcpQ domain-containing protein n=1 Tax=Vibrio mediterranei TaxID=689 RepID=UPI00185898F4|nr:TcpQ domain-containing protein [Vibrio mediterranei]NUW73663.1 TcpQ domain-containing protein [Vibrio mediterranei]
MRKKVIRISIISLFAIILPLKALSKVVIVSNGDTLYSILRDNGIRSDANNVSCMVAINKIPNVRDIKVGTRLSLPSISTCKSMASVAPDVIGTFEFPYVENNDSKFTEFNEENNNRNRDEVKITCSYTLPKNADNYANTEGFNCGFAGKNQKRKSESYSQNTSNKNSMDKNSFNIYKDKTLYYNITEWMNSINGTLRWNSEVDSRIISDISFGNDFRVALKKLSSYYGEYRFTYYEKNNVLEVTNN